MASPHPGTSVGSWEQPASSDRGVFVHARRLPLRLVEVPARRVIALLPAYAAITLVGYDTVFSHPGRRISGEARHRDPVRPPQVFTAWRRGDKRPVLAVHVRFPFAARPWAMPLLVVLDRTGGRSAWKMSPPHACPAGNPALAVDAPLVSRMQVRRCRRLGIRDARPRPIRAPAPRVPDAREQDPSGGEPVRARLALRRTGSPSVRRRGLRNPARPSP